MKKKIILFALCAILIWCGFIAWNWAHAFAEITGIAYQAFDILAGALCLGALICSCAASGEMKQPKTE